MGVISTGAIFKTLTFDGRSSSEFNVYITGEGVFNAPERAVEMISIPGRNGAFALDNGRFENIEVTYNCGIAGDSDTDFAEAVSAFRNWLCSRNGYVRLTDDYNANEYRMAIYKSGLEVTAEQLIAGEFPIVFECKPQRFLTSGDDLLSLNQYRELAGTDTTPYLFRASPQFSTSYDTEMDELVGGTLAVNQLCNPSTATKSASGVTLTESDGVFTFTTNVRNEGMFFIHEAIAGHKYVYATDIKTTTPTNLVELDSWGINIHYTTATTSWQNIAYVFNMPSSRSNMRIRIIDTRTSDWDAVQVKNTMVFDLTQMFGSTIADYVYNLEQSTAGSGVAWLKQYYPSIFSSYQPYNAGELMSVEGLESHDTVGFNQFDKTATSYVSGSYRYFDIPIGATQELYISFTDKDTSVDVSDANVGFTIVNAGRVNSYIWNMTAGVINPNHSNITNGGDDELRGRYCPYLFIYPNTQDVLDRLLARYDICINISSDRNGEYEAYTQTSYPLDSDLVLRGIPKISNGVPYYDGDIYESDGSVNRRYGVVDLGTLTWTKNTNHFAAELTGTKRTSGWNVVVDFAMCNKYTADTANNVAGAVNDKCFGITPNSDRVAVCDSTYSSSTAADFKTAMSGVYLVYELATPTTETADPFTNPQVVYAGGTEEYITNNVVPVGHNTKYGMNPAVVYNPTLFESRPMLEVTGSGAVNLNDDTIQINNDPIGDVVIFEQQTKKTASAWPVYIETQYANAGDPIFVTECQYTVSWTLSRGKISDITYTTTGDGNAGVDDVGAGMSPIVWLEDVEFAFGTASTITTTATFTIVTTYYGTLTADITLSIAYDGASQLILSHTATRPTQFSSASPRKTIRDVILRSSQIALGNPIYIDLNIGEAYKIENDVPVSVNNGVVIPAELPTLAPGANMITCDDTITQLDIVPRWWKI